MNPRILIFSLYTLSIVLAISLILSLISVLGFIQHIPFIDVNNLHLLPGISISCGAIIATLAFFRDRQYQKKLDDRKSDELYLNIARDSFNEVYDLLKDQNNDSLIWIRASRLLLHTLNLKPKIKTNNIIEAFEVAEEKLRTELYRTLTITDEKHKIKQPLPPQFFYGISDWSTEKSLDEAAIKGGSKTVVSSVNIHQNIPESGATQLAAKTIIAIYDFLEFPHNYTDPLENIKAWDENWKSSCGVTQGAKRFLAHVNEHYVINGKLHKKEADK